MECDRSGPKMIVMWVEIRCVEERDRRLSIAISRGSVPLEGVV